MDENLNVDGDCFNSPDIEFEPVADRYGHLGNTSIEAMLENCLQDRVGSKEAYHWGWEIQTYALSWVREREKIFLFFFPRHKISTVQ